MGLGNVVENFKVEVGFRVKKVLVRFGRFRVRRFFRKFFCLGGVLGESRKIF